MNARRIGWLVLTGFTLLLMLGAIALVVAPIFMTLDTYGVHDWDQMEAHRYLAVKTLERYHQFPFWNPYSCGGHTWWGGLESGTNLVSPWLPAYLLLSLPMALRVEIVGAALLSSVGTWMFAGRFTRSPALRLIAVVAFSLDGRFGLQTGAGHTWHLYYAWTPWALYFLDRAIGMAPAPFARPPHRIRDTALLGASLAMMVYTGGIYPLPQTIVVIALYAIACAVAARSIRPVGVAIGGGLLSFAFAAPRLIPIIVMLRRFPRLVDSPESMDLTGLIGVYTSKENAHPSVGPWGWHEFGIYTGWIPFLLMILAALLSRRARERALWLSGGSCLLIGLGRFSPYAPWAILHDWVPVFESQHVPSRWLYPATLLLVVAAASILERFLSRQSRRGLLELALVFVAAYVGLDVGLEAQRPLVGAFARHLAPTVHEGEGPFHQEKSAPPGLSYDGSDWAPIALPPMMANVGVIECGTFPGLDSYYRDRAGHLPGLGAKGKGDAAYRGETYFATGTGGASIENWSPNAVTVHYGAASPGDVLVLNQNWDPGWHAPGGVVDWSDLVAVRVPASSGDLTFRYRSVGFLPGLLLLVATIVGLIWASRRARVRDGVKVSSSGSSGRGRERAADANVLERPES